ncbi:MAG: pilus assembly protein PilV [Betaproteobacteria bacterium]
MTNRARQSGVMLIEALVGMLIFLIGVLALMGMQAAALSNTTQAKYRSDAALFAGQIVSQMWSDPANIPSYAYLTGGTSPNANVNVWVARISNTLPGTTAAVNPPVIRVSALVNGGYDIDVTVRWQAPNETAATGHNFRSTSRIAFN